MYRTKSRRCLGIDPGLANTGYTLVCRKHATEQFTLLQSGCIQTETSSSQAKRLLKIYQEISELIHVHTPNIVAIERVYFNRNVSSAITTAGVIGVCLLAAEQLGIESLLLTPQQAKAATGGTGSAGKKQVQRMISHLTGSVLKNRHAADAAAVAIAGLLHPKEGTPKCQKELPTQQNGGKI